ncbi:MAG TPA: hypothetical protein VLI41_06075 [Phenylobacterium sp.]|uniref:hypothetical protein n=1 Tax=Phenylobacterium sp. TaxID=1871053 RepID=UPI002B85A438|nr:hypothetical protein [Phenylobacterium sp.]HSV02756.1 hypothetical protein [Phenylobacterium sp.]
MKMMFLAVCSAFALSACADDYYGYNGYGYNDYGYPGYSSYYAGDVYYDGFYGPYASGYWGPNDVFFFSRRAGGPFIADRRHHFRHRFDAGSRRFGDTRFDRHHDFDHDHHR